MLRKYLSQQLKVATKYKYIFYSESSVINNKKSLRKTFFSFFLFLGKLHQDNSWGKYFNVKTKKIRNNFFVEESDCCKKEKCYQVYIRETKRKLKFRLDDHWGYVNNYIDNATGSHFNLAGHSLADLSVTVIEKVKKLDDAYRKEQEEYFIRKFSTLHKGLNRKYQKTKKQRRVGRPLSCLQIVIHYLINQQTGRLG